MTSPATCPTCGDYGSFIIFVRDGTDLICRGCAA